MYQYRIYGMCLLSDISFPQLQVISAEDAMMLPQITVTEASFPMRFKREPVCYSHIEKETSYLSNSYCYLLAEQGKHLTYEKKGEVPDFLLGAYLLGWGISMLCYQQGRLPLHGSCVTGPDGALLICGNSGSGKSTVTRELLSRGYTFLADDISVLQFNDDNTVSASPAFPYQKLCRDAVERLSLPPEELIYIDEHKDKFLVPYKGDFPTAPAPVCGLVFLTATERDSLTITELSGVAKFQTCMNAMFLKPLLSEALYAPENGTVGLRLASLIPVYLVERPVNRDCSKDIVSELLTHII